jgi:hypothetical protein
MKVLWEAVAGGADDGLLVFGVVPDVIFLWITKGS